MFGEASKTQIDPWKIQPVGAGDHVKPCEPPQVIVVTGLLPLYPFAQIPETVRVAE